MSQIQHGREGNEPPADPLSPIAFPDDFYRCAVQDGRASGSAALALAPATG